MAMLRKAYLKEETELELRQEALEAHGGGALQTGDGSVQEREVLAPNAKESIHLVQ